jgi:hypothetical protein
MRIITIVIAFAACGGSEPKPRAVENRAPANDAAAWRDCSCFSWVHLDENGENCYPDEAACKKAFDQFGRTDKIPCAPAKRKSCGGYACRDIGKECYPQ